jgi:acyl-CoA thioester hydrolase
VLGWKGEREGIGVILARIDCDFAIPLALGDPIRVYVRASRLGNKSFDFEHLIVRETDQAEAARGKSVLVAYDYDSDQSVPVPEEWRARMIAFEPGLQEPGR